MPSTDHGTPLASRCAHLFTQQVRARGQQYFVQQRVTLKKDANGVRAQVTGTQNYSVDVRTGDSDAGLTLTMSCSCPHFAAQRACKHLYATLLAADADKIPLVKKPGKIQALLSALRPPEPARPQNKRPKPARWRKMFAEARPYSDDHFDQDWGSHTVPPQSDEILYVLDINWDRAEVALYERRRRPDGEFRKPTPLHLRPQVASHLPQPDRNIATLLMASSAMNNHNSHDHYVDHTVCHLYDDNFCVLPELCATGRLFLDKDDCDTALNWSPDEVELAVSLRSVSGQFELRGRLSSAGKPVPWSELVGISPDGLMLLAHTVAQTGARSAPWIRMFHELPTVLIPREEIHDAIAELLATCPSRIPLPKHLGWSLRKKPPTPTLHIQEESHYYDNSFTGTLSFAYESGSISASSPSFYVCDPKKKIASRRDTHTERSAVRLLDQLGLQPASQNTYRVAQGRLMTLVENLVERGWRVELTGKKVRAPGGFDMSISSGVDWFDLDGHLEFDDQKVSLPEILRAAQAKQAFVSLPDGSRGLLPKQWLSKHEKMLRLSQVHDDKLRFASSQALFLDALLEHERDARVDATFNTLRRQLARATTVRSKQESKSFNGTLRPYQREGLGWLKFLQTLGLGGCLADDMGLGKTIQVLALLLDRHQQRKRKKRPSLIVVPKSLVDNWIDEAARFVPRLRVQNHTGPDRSKDSRAFEQADLVVTTYGLLRRDSTLLSGVEFDYVILDEAQAIKNPTSHTARTARLLRAQHRLAVTGTPVENHLGELGSIFDFLNPGMFDGQALRKLSTSFAEDPEGVKWLARALRPFVLRRTKSQVLPDLPPKTESTLFCDLLPKQRTQYDQLKRYYQAELDQRFVKQGFKRSGIHILAALLRLRQAACHPGLIDQQASEQAAAKLELLDERLLKVVEGGHKALVFSQFTSFLRLVRAKLDQRGIVYAYLDGTTTKRKQVINRFQTDAACPIFLISLKAGGHGLNLTGADYVFLLDPWWNPAVEAQAIDRVHRIGQTKPVFAYRIVARNTVEEKILELQERKRTLANSIYTGSGGLTGLTPDDVKMLLG